MRLMLLTVAMLGLALPSYAQVAIRRVEGDAPPGTIEIRGVGAGDFRPESWEAGTLNFNFDARAPLLTPREGEYRNIYAPSAVREDDGWRIYYGAWDGVETPNDRIYVTSTSDFLDFGERRMVIDHGVFIHVCNCCAIKLPDGAYRMMCTAYPHREGGLNRPAGFTSADGLHWDWELPHVADYDDLVAIEGYENWEDADINGVNAILYEDGVYRLYFLDWHNPGHIYRASSTDFETFVNDGPVYDGTLAVNDVRRFDLNDETWYLLAAHLNGDTMWYALSRDGMNFDPAHVLTHNQSADDRYMVAVGWVTDENRVLGFLYGAGAESHLAANRIFAKWLQKKVVFCANDGRVFNEAAAHGPDALRLKVPEGELTGRFRVFAEDGVTPLAESESLAIEAGQCWRVAGGDGAG